MKKYYLILCCLIFSNVFAQGLTCATATGLCNGGPTFTFANITDSPSVADGIDYGCLLTYPNKQWFSLHIVIPGNLDFQITQIATNGTPIDVDYILWGPFPSAGCGAANLTAATTISCSYSVAAVENCSIQTNISGEYYTLMIANFNGQPGAITLTQTNQSTPGSGVTSCGTYCTVNLGSDYALCDNTPTTLHAQTDYPSTSSYQWTSSVAGVLPQTTQDITVTEPATYTVVVNCASCFNTNYTDSITLTQFDAVFQPPNDLTICNDTTSGVFDLTEISAIVVPVLNPNYYYIDYYHTESDAINEANPIANPTAYLGTDGEFVYYNIINMVYGCSHVEFFRLYINTPNPEGTINVDGQTATVIPVGNNTFQYQLDNGALQSSPIFTNVELGNHTIIISNACGNSPIPFVIVTPSAPFGISPQYYTEGQTLANLVMNGQNIQWYANPASSGFWSAETPLPMSTVLVNGMTYYATQTVNGVESVTRFAVTVLSTLGNANNTFSNFTYYPNPVKNNLKMVNAEVIDSVSITSVLGQVIFSKTVNSMEADIDLSALSNGVYFVKVSAGGQNKTIRIIKE